jgi:hypothetical protein
MKANNIVYQARLSGYYFVYDNDGFINVFESAINDDKNQCVYRAKTKCASQKDFEVEAIYVSQKVYEL